MLAVALSAGVRLYAAGLADESRSSAVALLRDGSANAALDALVG